MLSCKVPLPAAKVRFVAFPQKWRYRSGAVRVRSLVSPVRGFGLWWLGLANIIYRFASFGEGGMQIAHRPDCHQPFSLTKDSLGWSRYSVALRPFLGAFAFVPASKGGSNRVKEAACLKLELFENEARRLLSGILLSFPGTDGGAADMLLQRLPAVLSAPYLRLNCFRDPAWGAQHTG